MNRMRACVCVVLRARSELDTACLAGVHRRPYACDRYRCMVRSYTKSEYAQPLVDPKPCPKQTLFDVNIMF